MIGHHAPCYGTNRPEMKSAPSCASATHETPGPKFASFGVQGDEAP